MPSFRVMLMNASTVFYQNAWRCQEITTRNGAPLTVRSGAGMAIRTTSSNVERMKFSGARFVDSYIGTPVCPLTGCTRNPKNTVSSASGHWPISPPASYDSILNRNPRILFHRPASLDLTLIYLEFTLARAGESDAAAVSSIHCTGNHNSCSPLFISLRLD
jgi:hypothetical protein